MTGIDTALLLIALVCMAAVIARAGDARVWAVIAGLCVVAVLLGVQL